MLSGMPIEMIVGPQRKQTVGNGFLVLAIALVLGIGGCKPTPPREPKKKPKLELTLQLARKQWQAGEPLWYLLKVKNVGQDSFSVYDSFWKDQAQLSRNSMHGGSGTYFQVLSPSGKVIRPDFLIDWGFHGEGAMWDNDTSSYKAPIEPGETMTATPSIPAALRRSNGSLGIADIRTPPDASPEERKSYEKLQAMYPKFQSKDGQPPAPVASGYRVLEGYHFYKPGVYRIKVIYNNFIELTPTTPEEETERLRRSIQRLYSRDLDSKTLNQIRTDWQAKSPAEIAEIHKERKGDEKANAEFGFYFESNEVEFEVVP